ncbi:MAG: cytochrome C assembly family protein [Pseudomonadota bacterium]
MPLILTYSLAALLYAAVAGLQWRARARAVGAQDDGAAQAPASAWPGHLILIPLALHGYALANSVFGPGGLHLGIANAVSAIVFLTLLVYWVASLFWDMRGLLLILAPAAAIAALLPLLAPSLDPLPNTNVPAFKYHLLIAMLAYSLFTIAALHAVLMALAERRLHHPTRSSLLGDFPPLLSMETLLFRILWAGFVLLTLTLATGFVFSEELLGKPLQFSHKTVFGILSWLIFASLLAGRAMWGWRGRVAIRWTLAGFIALFLAYVGSKFVLEVILGR